VFVLSPASHLTSPPLTTSPLTYPSHPHTHPVIHSLTRLSDLSQPFPPELNRSIAQRSGSSTMPAISLTADAENSDHISFRFSAVTPWRML
jgi:hypothetical protein